MLDQDAPRNKRVFIRGCRSYAPPSEIKIYDKNHNLIRTEKAQSFEEILRNINRPKNQRGGER